MSARGSGLLYLCLCTSYNTVLDHVMTVFNSLSRVLNDTYTYVDIKG